MENRQKNYKIAIDGRAGTGKSTIARLLAKRLGIIHINSGDMYRAVTYYFVSNNIEITQENINKYIDGLNIELNYIEGMNVVMLNGENVTNKLRTDIISKTTSEVARYKEVREKLTQLQRETALTHNVVMEGRDIGSNVFPDSELKIFIVTDMKIRAVRRQADLQKQNIFLSIEEVTNELKTIDNNDENRTVNPMKKTEDAVVLSTDMLPPEETVEKIVDLMIERDLI